MTRTELLMKMDNPRELEKLYQENKGTFKTEFNLLYPELSDSPVAVYWNERLNYESSAISWGSKNEVTFIVIASLIAGLIAKLPDLLNLDHETFYQRNLSFVIFPVLTTYFTWKNRLSAQTIVFAGLSFLIGVIFINYLPADRKSDTLLLSCIHLPLFLWAVLGFSYAGQDIKSHNKRLGFLRYNGDLVIMTTVVLISGGILTAITIGLFELIGFDIKKFYFEYFVVVGLAAVPIVATYITQTNPQLVSKVSPVIAKIFSPLVLITLVAYLVAIMFSGKDPYNNRDFLMVFNFLLIGVMAIILFSIAETIKNNKTQTNSVILFALSVVTLIVNGIALSAILFRISSWGITPNRLAVLGGNIMMLTNLLLITFKLFKNIRKKGEVSEVEEAISIFLPFYIIWTIIVTFIFPLAFNFK